LLLMLVKIKYISVVILITKYVIAGVHNFLISPNLNIYDINIEKIMF